MWLGYKYLYTRHGFSPEPYCVSGKCSVVSGQLVQQICCQFRVYCHKLPTGAAGIVSLHKVLPKMVNWCSRHCVSAVCTAVCGQLVQQTCCVSECTAVNGELAQQALCQCSVYCCMWPVVAADLLCQLRVYCHKLLAGTAHAKMPT